MHEKQLPRELAVIGGGVCIPMIPTGQIKRVAAALLEANLGRGDHGRAADSRGQGLAIATRGGAGRRSADGSANRAGHRSAAAAASVATTAVIVTVTVALLALQLGEQAVASVVAARITA